MADDLVVREWDWSVYGGLLTRQILDEHNTLARAYLERDAQLAEANALIDSSRHAWEMTRRARDLVLAKLTASEAARVSDLNDLDAVCALLGIQDSDTTPAEAIQELKSDLERERVKASKLATALQALLGTTTEERQTPSIWFPRVDAAREALHEFAEIFALIEPGKAGEP